MSKTAKCKCTFREATEKDIPLLIKFIKILAEYEKMSDDMIADENLIREWVFEKKSARAIFVCDESGREVGTAIYFFNFSTFLGRAGLYLEDLIVYPEERGKGYGKALLVKLAGIANELGCGRMEWSCLNWNAPSIAFYKSLGAVPMDEWTVYRLTADKIAELANS